MTIAKTARAWCVALLLGSLIWVVDHSLASADCVEGLALCAVACDERTKPTTPERPQCARSCVSKYQRCERIEVFRPAAGGGGGVLDQGMTLAPAQ